MQNKQEKISVLLATYNDSSTITQSIESILSQTYENFELLILDDCSTDDTFHIADELVKKDSRLFLQKNNVNLGLTKSLNILIQKSSGNFIARQDADDISLPNRLQFQVQVMSNYNLDFCTTRSIRTDSNRIVPFFSHYIPKKILINYKNPFIHGTLMAKKEVFIKTNNYDEKYYYSQDYKLFKDFLNQNFKYKVISKPLYLLNMVDNISTNKSEEQKYYADCVRKNIEPDLII